MAVRSLKTGLFSRSMLVGNDYYIPPAFESIATATGTGSSGTIIFSSIPGTYKHLQLRGLVFSSGGDEYVAEFNSDTTGTNYAHHRLTGEGTAVAAAGFSSANNYPWVRVGSAIAGTDATYGSAFVLDILDYTSTTKNKTSRAFSGCDKNGTGDLGIYSGLYFPSTIAAISTIKIKLLSGSFSTNTTIALYGIKEA